MPNPDRPLSELPYDVVLTMQRRLATLESNSLRRLLRLGRRPYRGLDQTPEWVLWKSACQAHDQLLDELDRRELHLEDA